MARRPSTGVKLSNLFHGMKAIRPPKPHVTRPSTGKTKGTKRPVRVRTPKIK